MGDLENKDKGEFTIVDPDNNAYEMEVNSDGSINVVIVTPTPPATTIVHENNQEVVSKVGGTGGFAWTIPSGETFTLLTFTFTGSIDQGTVNPLQSKAEIYYRPGGSGVAAGEVRVGTIYLGNQSYGVKTYNDGNEEFAGDGTAVMEVDITNWSKDQAEFEPEFTGYY